MADLILRRWVRRTRQPLGSPEIDWTNPICRGLVGLIWAGGGKPRDLLDPSLALSYTSTLRPTPKGMGYGADVAGKGIYTARAGGSKWKLTTPSLTCVVFGTANAHTATSGFGGYAGSPTGYYLNTLYSTGDACVQTNVDLTQRLAYGTGPWKNPSAIAIRGLTVTPTLITGYDHGVSFGSAGYAAGTYLSYDNTYGRLEIGTDGTDYIGGPQTGLWMALWNRPLSPAEMLSLQERPWQLFAPIARRVWVPVSAGGAITIDCTPGNAVAAGTAATISIDQTLACSVGNATAAGVAAAVSTAQTIACSVGNAVAAGSTAALTTDQTIPASVGNAVAAGVAAAIEVGSTITINCVVGNAAADGIAASILADEVLACSVGSATAAGYSATVSVDQTISGNVANATAAGLTAGIVIDQTIACTVGNAVAAGAACTIEMAGGTASAAEVWGYTMSNGYTAEQNVVAIRTMLEALTPAVIAEEVLHNALV